MPTLNWIGREALINHHNEIPYHLLRCNGTLSVGDAGNGNLLIDVPLICPKETTGGLYDW